VSVQSALSQQNDGSGQERQQELRKLPGVDRLLQEGTVQAQAAAYGRELTVTAVREALDAARQSIQAGEKCPAVEQLIENVAVYLAEIERPSLLPVVNATGVIIHTNLGRSPLSPAARSAMEAVARGYSNLEYELAAGQRGSRHVHAARLLCHLSGAEAAMVVNNNAAAVLLILSALARDREVVISRGQLVEIGGGFRIPDVMRQSGAHLLEVGTTNRTYLADYEAAISEKTALLLRVHHSNFRLVGFTAEPTAAELAELGERYGIPLVEDLGSGTLLDTAPYGLAHEPTIQESLAAGASLVSASGDKLLGGPQAGVIVGRQKLVEQLKRHPLARALRVDKTTLAGLEATLGHYLRGEAEREVPVWRMIAAPLAEITERARSWAGELARRGIAAEVVDGESTVGGGSLPGEALPSRLLALRVPSPDGLAARLRAGNPPVVARIEAERLLLDPRTVLPDQDESLLAALQTALDGTGA
jgi:L-seryl-tRNA(Ser) seleniumtransferase